MRELKEELAPVNPLHARLQRLLRLKQQSLGAAVGGRGMLLPQAVELALDAREAMVDDNDLILEDVCESPTGIRSARVRSFARVSSFEGVRRVAW